MAAHVAGCPWETYPETRLSMHVPEREKALKTLPDGLHTHSGVEVVVVVGGTVVNVVTVVVVTVESVDVLVGLGYLVLVVLVSVVDVAVVDEYVVMVTTV